MNSKFTGESTKKFLDPILTANGDTRATVALTHPETLWFNTGTLCNITCVNCYIESSPTNDALAYMGIDDVENFLKQVAERNWPIQEIGFTGGEPFMNPNMAEMARLCLKAGYSVLILTNAMLPMMRKSVKKELNNLNQEFAGKLTLRVSLDHYRREQHDAERGSGSYEITLRGMDWLRDNQIKMAVAGRTIWGEDDAVSRAGFGVLFATRLYNIDSNDRSQTVLFPEMDDTSDVPEITTGCWDVLGQRPDDLMCASSRMVVKRKGAHSPVVLACTLITNSQAFELGNTLEDAEKDVFLNHRYCAKFCVLGGAKCSAQADNSASQYKKSTQLSCK